MKVNFERDAQMLWACYSCPPLPGESYQDWEHRSHGEYVASFFPVDGSIEQKPESDG